MRQFLLILALFFVGVSTQSAFAECRTTPITYSFTANAVLSADGVTSETGFCRITFWTNQGVYTDVSIAKKPQNGKLVQVNTTTYEYKTNPNFKGKDQFTLQACGTARYGGEGCAMVTFNMQTP